MPVALLSPEEVEPGKFPPQTEHVCFVRIKGEIVAEAWNLPQLEVDSHWLSAIGVGTHPAFRNQGLGYAVVSTLLTHLTDEGGAALWNCSVTNIPSRKLADAVGFQAFMYVFSWQEDVH